MRSQAGREVAGVRGEANRPGKRPSARLRPVRELGASAPRPLKRDRRSIHGLRENRAGRYRREPALLHDAEVAAADTARRIAWEPVTRERPAAARARLEAAG